MGRATGSIVTLALLVLFALASTSPARAAVPGRADNGPDARHGQGAGDQGGPEHQTDAKGQSGPDAQGRQRDGGDRAAPQPDVEQRDDKQRDDKQRDRNRAQSQRVDKQRDDKDRDQPQRDDKQRDDRERDEPQRDDKDRDQPQRDDKDRDDKDGDEPEREDKARDDKGRDEKPREDEDRPAPRPERETPRPRGDEGDDRDEADGPRGDRTPPAEARRTPRRPLEGESSSDASPSTTGDVVDDTAPVTSTPPGSDGGPPVISDATPPLDPESLQTMGLGGYVAGDFGWFDGRSGGGQFFGVPDVPAMIGGLPVLLAILGAFLALQRGIGQGLGHVPMDPTSTEQGPHGQH